MIKLRFHRVLTVVALSTAAFQISPAWAITIGQIDDFQTGDSLGWGGFSQSIDVPSDGGPLGAGDGYLSYASNGLGGPNSRILIPNEGVDDRWTGDYASAGVTGIQLDVLNPGAADLDLRLAVANASTWYVTTTPVEIAGQSAWSQVTFTIDEGIMTRVGLGLDTLADVLSGVTRVRLLSSVDLPTVSFGGTGGAQGDLIEGSIGVDNITALGVPEPSAWILACGLTVGALGRRRLA